MNKRVNSDTGTHKMMFWLIGSLMIGIFSIELGIMFILDFLHETLPLLSIELLDGALLVTLLVPYFYFVFYRPVWAKYLAERERTGNLIDTINGIIWEADVKTGRTLFISHQVEQVLGYRMARWINEPYFWKKYVHPDDLDAVIAATNKALAEKKNFSVEYRVITADGKPIWFRDSVTSNLDERSQVRSLSGVMIDITSQKQMESELIAKQKQLQELFSFTQARNHVLSVIFAYDDPLHIFKTIAAVVGDVLQIEQSLLYHVDFEKRRITCVYEWVNDEAPDVPEAKKHLDLVLFKSSSDYLLSKWHPLESHVDEINPLLMEDGIEKLLHDDLKIKSLLWIPLTDKKKFYVLVLNQLSRRRIWRDEELKFLEAMASQMELALQKLNSLFDRKAVKERLLESNELLEKIFDTTHLMIAYLDRDLNFIRVNRAYAEANKHTACFFTGLNHFALFPDDENQAIFQKVIETGEPYFAYDKSFEHPVLGLTYWDYSLYPVKKADGSINGLILSCMNVTERRTLAEQLRQAQKIESVGTLAGGVAHDFNNILTVIQGYTDLMLRTCPEESTNCRYLNTIKKATDTAANLTNQLLLFSRKKAAVMANADLNALIDDFAKMLRRMLGENYSFEYILSPDLAGIYADIGHMEQVIMNLFVNARDAMPEGGKITVRTENATIDAGYCQEHSFARPGEFVCLTVQDHGIGMDNATLSKIFEPFFTTKEPGKGTGLGLSVVYGIIKQHNGWITVESKSSQGSTFRIYLPAVEKKDKMEAAKEEKAYQCAKLDGRVLLIEDEDHIRNLVDEVLRGKGMVVIAAGTIQEAKTIFEREQGNFDLVISDVVLPDGNGIRLMDSFKASKPDLLVLLNSGYSPEVMGLQQAIQQQRYAFMHKPFGTEELLHQLAKLMAASR